MVIIKLLSQISQIKFCGSYMSFENQNLSSYLRTILFIFIQRFCKACFSEFRERFPIFVNWATAGGLVSVDWMSEPSGNVTRMLTACRLFPLTQITFQICVVLTRDINFFCYYDNSHNVKTLNFIY